METTAKTIEQYIAKAWKDLTRSNKQLARSAVDPKFHLAADPPWPVYIAADEDEAHLTQLLKNEMPAADFEKLKFSVLAANGVPPREPGLLYLPRPYVVPGGRFNEMYGWDSYFIQVGLLRDGELALSKDMADNCIYQILHYGKILNANRSYYLTRSQPPFLTQMLLGVYNRIHDLQWLEESLSAIERYYQFWTTAPHLTTETGLSRYIDSGEGPAPEVLSGEKDAHGQTHYEVIKQYFRTNQVSDYDLDRFYDRSRDELLPACYKGDRSMRESGFDPSNRFGPFNLDIIHYNPLCLNSLLHVMEVQTAEILAILGRTSDTALWMRRAKERRQRINDRMWHEQDGLYYDYNFVAGSVRWYPFLTTFYPMWAGIARPEQAARIVRNLGMFDAAGGLLTSTSESGNQWDKPFGWAPLHMLAVSGLRRYGYEAEADRISVKFLSMIIEDYTRTGTIVEKYDVIRRGSDVSESLKFGYRSNEIGFGWTNAVFTTLLDQLSTEARSQL
jgi:alpha,alpha-trehalase